MPITDTPLRYPGGKSQLAPLVVDILGRNNLFYGEYAEPFAGGAGLAMTLLLNDYVTKVYLNDIDPAIFAFWHSVLNESEALCKKVNTIRVNMAEWHKQRAIFMDVGCDSLLAKGFATLFLNRTNRSGILRGGVIGGLQQTGDYKLDCRFNREDLTRKIRRIAQYRDQIELSCMDAATFVKSVVPRTSQHTLVNLDPPYYGKGPELYTNYYRPEDHAALALAVARIKRHWIVTYDDEPEIRSLYATHRMYGSTLNYSVQVKRVGVELLVVDDTLNIPAEIESCRVSSDALCVKA